MSGEMVTCADCGGQLPKAEADIIEYGTGYRCEKCAVSEQIEEHVEASIENQRRRTRRAWQWSYLPNDLISPVVDAVAGLIRALRSDKKRR